MQAQLDAAQDSIGKLQQEVQQQAAEKQEALQRVGQAQVEMAALRYAFTDSLISRWLGFAVCTMRSWQSQTLRLLPVSPLHALLSLIRPGKGCCSSLSRYLMEQHRPPRCMSGAGSARCMTHKACQRVAFWSLNTGLDDAAPAAK